MIEKLVAYIMAAFSAWTQLPATCAAPNDTACAAWQHVYDEHPDDARLRLTEVATELAAATVEHEARPNVPIELGATAFEESKLSRLIDDGTCNRKDLDDDTRARVTALGGCDSGTSWGMWQMRPPTLGDVYRGPLTGPELLASHALQVRIAWDLRRRRPMAWSTWAKARARAGLWLAAHPFAAGTQ